MHNSRNSTSRSTARLLCFGFGLFLCLVVAGVEADGQILSIPYPEPSTNGAQHYNRALLSLSMIPLAEREVLSKPIWEAFGESSKEEIDTVVSELVYSGRHAIRAAIHGSDQKTCDFGIDYSDHSSGGVLPHAQPMLRLGRLITLAGINAQIDGEWENSATLFFRGMRIGRHMAHEPTLIEALIGVEILENNYFALAFWAAKCPEPTLVKQAFLRFELASRSMVRPVASLAYEASIVERQVQRVKTAFPDGRWAEMLLESLGEYAGTGERAELEKRAGQICAERGVPSEIFQSKDAFDKFADQFSKLHVTYLRAGAACMNLPPLARAERAKMLFESFEKRFEEVGDREVLDLRQIANYFSMHSAELTMARVALALAADRTSEGFPTKLDDIASRFVGKVPRSPYDGSALEYQLLNQGQDFTVAVPEVTAHGVTMPRVEFSSYREK